MKKEMKSVLFVMNLALTALAVEPACPVCSRYHYEDMLLERVLRNELALEQTLKDIMGTNTKVVEALAKLQDKNDKVNKAIESMECKQIILEATVNDALKTSLTNVSDSLSHIQDVSGRAIKDMKGRVERIKGEMQTPTILFRAQLASSITVNSGQDVVFTRVEVNEGQGYDKGTGKFTASVAGLYIFPFTTAVIVTYGCRLILYTTANLYRVQFTTEIARSMALLCWPMSGCQWATLFGCARPLTVTFIKVTLIVILHFLAY